MFLILFKIILHKTTRSKMKAKPNFQKTEASKTDTRTKQMHQSTANTAHL